MDRAAGADQKQLIELENALIDCDTHRSVKSPFDSSDISDPVSDPMVFNCAGWL